MMTLMSVAYLSANLSMFRTAIPRVPGTTSNWNGSSISVSASQSGTWTKPRSKFGLQVASSAAAVTTLWAQSHAARMRSLGLLWIWGPVTEINPIRT